MDGFITRVAAKLDRKAYANFNDIERRALMHAMLICRMALYPPVAGDPDGERASGEMICERCGQVYYAHPLDWRVIGCRDRPFLNVLCDGRRVKL